MVFKEILDRDQVVPHETKADILLPMEKRTDKIKKKTFGGFYSEFAKWNPKGKSSKEKDEMIADLKNCITHQLVRIKKHKYVIEILKEERDQRITTDKVRAIRLDYKRKLANQKNKVSSRDNNLEAKTRELEELEKSLKLKEREVNRLLRAAEKKDEVLKEVKQSKRRVVYKEVVTPPSAAAKRLEKIASKPMTERAITTLDVTLKTSKFAEDRGMHVNLLTILIHIDSMTSSKFSDLVIGTRANIAQLMQRDLITFQLVKQVKHYFLTMKGTELIKNYKDFINHSKIL